MNNVYQEKEYEKEYENEYLPILTKNNAHYITCERVKNYLSGLNPNRLPGIRNVLKLILEYDLIDDRRSIADIVNLGLKLISRPPFNKEIDDIQDDRNPYIALFCAFVSANRSDTNVYNTIYDNYEILVNEHFNYIFGIPYIYSPNELRIAIYTLIKLQEEDEDAESYGEEPDFKVTPENQFGFVAMIREFGRMGIKKPGVQVMYKFVNNVNKDNKLVYALLSLRPKPTVHVAASSLLTPKEYVKLMYERAVMNFDTGMKAETMFKKEYDGLYVEYNTPNDLKVVFGENCSSYLLFVGESHGKTHVQPYGFDPRFGFGEVPLPFKTAIITENPLNLPNHLIPFSEDWTSRKSLKQVFSEIKKFGYDRNKLQLMLQITEGKPLTGYAPKIKLNRALNSNSTSHNFDILLNLYKDIDQLYNDYHLYEYGSNEKKKLFKDIAMLRKYLFGTLYLPNVKEYSSDCRRPYTEQLMFDPLRKLAEYSDWNLDNLPFINELSYVEIVSTVKYNPDQDIYFYYHLIIKYLCAYSRSFTKYVDRSVKRDLKELIHMLKGFRGTFYNDSEFKKAVDEHVKNESRGAIDIKASIINQYMKHPDKLKDPDHLKKIFMADNGKDISESALNKLMNDTGDPTVVLNDRLSDENNNDDRNLLGKILYKYASIRKAYRDSFYDGEDSNYRDLNSDEKMEYALDICDKLHLTIPQMAKEVFMSEVPYSFDKFDWDFIEKIYKGMYFKRLDKPLPYADQIDKKELGSEFKVRNVAVFSQVCNVAFWMRLKQLIESDDPPEVIIIVCGSAHMKMMMSQLLVLRDEYRETNDPNFDFEHKYISYNEYADKYKVHNKKHD